MTMYGHPKSIKGDLRPLIAALIGSILFGIGCGLAAESITGAIATTLIVWALIATFYAFILAARNS